MNISRSKHAKSVPGALLAGLCLLLAGVPAMAAGVGELAPDFEVLTDEGEGFRLADYRGHKPVYVVFWNSWCSYCTKKTPRYRQLQEQLGDKIEIIAINTTWSESLEDMRSFAEHHGINYATAYDAGEHVTDLYDVYNVPTEFIIDIDGIIRYRDGVPEYLAAHLPDMLLPYVPSRNTVAFACTP